MNDEHLKYHSPNAFCGDAGPEEMQHLRDLIDLLTDQELKQLVENVGIQFLGDTDSFDREYRKIITLRSK